MILCGLFCAGKSTIGEALAAKMHLPFYDTDRLIEAKKGNSVSKIWQELGEEGFRALERAVVHTLKEEPCIIATGGGTLLSQENRAYLKQIGTPIYLKAPLLTLWERLQKRGVPAYLDIENPFEHFERLAKERFPLFEAYCAFALETENLSIEASVHALLK